MAKNGPSIALARECFTAGRYRQALMLLVRLPLKQRNSFEGRVLNAEILSALGDESGELRVAHELVARWPRRAESHLLLGEALSIRAPARARPYFEAAWRLFNKREGFLAENLLDSYLTYLAFAGDFDGAWKIFHEACNHPVIGDVDWLLKLKKFLARSERKLKKRA